MSAAVNLDELPTGGSRTWQFADLLERARDADLFAHFAVGRFFIGFAGIHMPGRRRVPSPRIPVLPDRASLKENFASLIENEDMDRAVPQVIHMHVIAGFCARHTILGIHHAKNFARQPVPLRASS